jgi:hypothetical protein
MLIVLFAPSLLLSANCSVCDRSSKSFTLLNDYHPSLYTQRNPLGIAVVIHLFFRERGEG